MGDEFDMLGLETTPMIAEYQLIPHLDQIQKLTIVSYSQCSNLSCQEEQENILLAPKRIYQNSKTLNSLLHENIFHCSLFLRV